MGRTFDFGSTLGAPHVLETPTYEALPLPSPPKIDLGTGSVQPTREATPPPPPPTPPTPTPLDSSDSNSSDC